MAMLLPWIGAIVAALAAFAIIRHYQANMVLFLGGLILNTAALLAGVNIFPASASSSGIPWFDPFELLNDLSSNSLLGVGLTTLVAGGYAAYMQAIGASSCFVNLVASPLRNNRDPYIVLGMVFIAGAMLCFAIPSAAGLAMLLIVTAYPLLTSLGCSRLSAAAVIASPMAVSFAPASSVANMAADVIGLNPITYMLYWQLPLAVPTILVMAIAHVHYQQHCDRESLREERTKDGPAEEKNTEKARLSMPIFIYALMPISPMIFILLFNKVAWGGLALNISTSMFICWFLAFAVDLVLRRNIRESFELSFAMFEGMGRIMTTTIGLLFVAAFFAMGLQNSGMLEAMLYFVRDLAFGGQGAGVMLTFMVGCITILTGSGVAAFTSCVSFVTDFAANIGIDLRTTVLMMDVTCEMARALSPIAGAVIIVSGYAGVNPFDVVKRTSVPCLAGFITMLTYIALRLGA